MKKYLKNNIIIALALTISSIILTILYYIKGLVLPSLVSFVGNILIMLLTILGVVIFGSIFMLATDSLFCKGKNFKERFFSIMKSLWLSHILMLPVSLILLIANFFVNLDISFIINVVVFSISYLSQLVLFFSYKFVTSHDWSTTIKVVASQFILATFLAFLMNFI